MVSILPWAECEKGTSVGSHQTWTKIVAEVSQLEVRVKNTFIDIVEADGDVAPMRRTKSLPVFAEQ